MTRFMMELSGKLGAYWKADAEKELAKVRDDLEAGLITIDDKGIARNCVGRVVMSDMLEKIALVTDKVDTDATAAARDLEVEKELEEYRRNSRSYGAEDLAEMRAAFGAGATVVDAITGKKIRL